MGSKWRTKTIKEIGNVITGKTPPGTKEIYFGGEVNFLTPSDMDESKYVESTQRTLSVSGAEVLKKNLIEKGIAVSCIGWQMGKSVIINSPTVTNQQINTLIPDSAQVDIEFLYYVLKLKRQEIFNLGATATRTPIVKKSLFEKIEIEFPEDLKLQKSIAQTLRSLDNKIILNKQINQTLEQMAQTLFKSWFVDFDPVKAKMNDEQPEWMDAPFLSKEVASLFPEKLVESELGLIPEGWGVGELSKLFELHRGFDLPKSKRQDGEYPVYAAGGYHGAHNEFKMEPPGIITGRSGVIGNVYLSLDKYWPLNTTLYVREFRTCGPYYAYHLLRSLDLKSLNSGSAVPSLNRNFVHSTNVCHPDSDVLAKFEEIVTPLFEKMVANNEQNKSLSELRDTLLPKLLSGEIDLENVQVEQAKALAE
ncbi:restriction endonuclease subunit S [Vibrio splendidus]|uniref:restriction endonuclease subunit S n=1 Tax=Vibrio splendidus TaxID=29497 RepID=UPI000D3C65E6|nr:restriction endonuclease subunit S [Vibrio splendidus]PTP80633.1 restriction endonuclease subunit S [Vibrio splendidus]